MVGVFPLPRCSPIHSYLSHTVSESYIPRRIPFMSRQPEGAADFMGLSGQDKPTCSPPSSSKLNQECQDTNCPRTFAPAQPDLARTIHVELPRLPLVSFERTFKNRCEIHCEALVC